MESEVLVSRGLDGELLRDPAFRFGGTTLAAHNGTTIDNQYDTGGSTPTTTDPVVYTALEGDQVGRCSGINADGEGWTLDVTSLTDNTTVYKFSCFLKAVGGAAGKTVDVVLEGLTPTGTGGDSTTLALTTDWQRVQLIGAFDFSDLSTVRRLRVSGKSGEGWGTGGPYEFHTDCVHLCGVISATLQGIEYSIDGVNFASEIEYLDAIDRPAGEVLDDIAKSCGGWFRENGRGVLVFEDFDDRDPALDAILRLTDDPQDGGHMYALTEYREPTGSMANRVRVGSYGDVTPVLSPDPKGARSNRIRIVWSLEPAGRTIAQNTLYTYYADYAAEGDEGGESESSLILRRGIAGTLPAGSWTADSGISTPYVVNYGRGGVVYLRGESGGSATLHWLAVGGRLQQRNTSERTFMETGSGEPVLVLDMPLQGYRTPVMGSVRDWASTKYSKGPPIVTLKLRGNTDQTRTDWVLAAYPGLPVWLRHKLGPGAFMLDGLFFVESVTLRHEPGDYPEVVLGLEEA
jgi:hypothetical protein